MSDTAPATPAPGTAPDRYRTAADRYLAFWNAPALEEQLRLGEGVFTESVEYHAPVGVLTGAAAMAGFRNQFVEHMGQARYAFTADPEGHHDRARLRWEILLADGTSFAEGTDVLALTGEDRIASVSSFLDRAPEGFDEHHDHHGQDEHHGQNGAAQPAAAG